MTATAEQISDFRRHELTRLRDELRAVYKRLAAAEKRVALLELMAARNDNDNRREAKGEG